MASHWPDKHWQGTASVAASPAAAGLYAGQSDIEDRFGAANVAAWSQTGGALGANGLPLADVGRIQALGIRLRRGPVRWQRAARWLLAEPGR